MVRDARSRILLTYLRPQRGRVGALALLLMAGIGLQLANPQLLRYVIDRASAGSGDRDLLLAAGLFLVIAVVQQLCAVTAVYLSENIGWTATNALRGDLLLHVLRLDQRFHKTRTPGELIERIDGDITTLANFFSQLVIQLAGNLLLLLGVLAVLWSFDWRIGLVLTVFAALVIVTLRLIQRLAAPRWRVARQRGAELWGFVEERLSGTEDIRSSGALRYTMYRLYDHLRAHYRAELRARVIGRLVWPASDVLFTVGTAAVYLVAARLYAESRLTIGTIYVVFFYVGLLMVPINQLTRQAEDLQKASAGIGRVQELLETRSALDAGGATPLPPGALPVLARDVAFGYDDIGDPALHGLSFELGAGRVLGLLGRTGSGKTTLTRLLFRLYDPQRGALALGDVDLRAVPLAELRRRVGIVTQEVQLFHASIRDNLTLFDPAIADNRIHAAIQSLGLQSWFGALPQGLDTVLAAGGRGLSAGEAQLLAFTRIFLRDPGLVILDEASSRLDPATEALIERAVGRLLVGRTGIIIAHRLHTVLRADEILILEGGQALEHGDRAALQGDPASRFAQLLRTGLEEALV